MIGPVMNEGVRGLQNSQREMVRSASEIARAGEALPATVVPSENSPLAPVEKSASAGRSGDIAEPLIELRRQELLFNASAKVVSTADKTIGNLLDTLA